jgi:Cu(I)/Ag(I) efflux system membrane fusion protein
VQPLLLLAAGALLIVGLGVAQKAGWISAGGGGESRPQASSGGEDVRYICPMMCTPPQTKPGRCPVCAMELVPASSGGDDTDEFSIQVDPVARRLANIQTVAVKAIPLARKIRTIGELSYDEGTLKTLSAYVDSRLDRLYADYTGVVVTKGDHLALLYSPQLYSCQVELLVSKRARARIAPPDQTGTGPLHRDLYDSARERLIEFGMTESQIAGLEQAGKADSRMYLCAPISGTVIEKCAVEGQYVKTGQPIYRLADLSTVWLMMELFPEDAAAIRYGQQVEAEVQSLPGKKFSGRVAFIDPTVDSKTRTVGVRVVVPNPKGLLRIGDYAKAKIDVPVLPGGGPAPMVYDPELANKWISPRHPHVVESSPGNCRVCGVELVPAANFGFANQPTDRDETLVVPRNAVLMAGENSVVYVEDEPGHFQLRPVTLGPTVGEEIAILQGVKKGEQVACSGNFLIDSQMQLAGKPSLIDPTKAASRGEPEEAKSAQLLAALSQLSDEDRILAESQEICPVTRLPLGSMGTPIKVDVNGRPVFICCKGCQGKLLSNPDEYLAKLPKEALR